jgi:hypothetical protein
MAVKPKAAAAKSWAADKVERRAVSSLVPYAENSRTHSDEQIDQICASIKEFGFTVPVLIDEAGGIIAGHGRVMAAQKMGIEEVPAMVATGWTEGQKRAYVIADNKLALNAGWDEEKLASELAALRDMDFDLNLTGFDESELDTLLDLGDEDGADAGGGPAPMKMIVQYNIIFDDEAQQEQWYAFVRHLKLQYPEAETIGARLALYIAENDLGEG